MRNSRVRERYVLQHQNSFVQRAVDDVILRGIQVLDGLLEIANSSVNDLCRLARGGPRKVPGFDQHGLQAAKLSIQRAGCTRRPAADHAHVERPALDGTQRFVTTWHGLESPAVNPHPVVWSRRRRMSLSVTKKSTAVEIPTISIPAMASSGPRSLQAGDITMSP